MTPSPPASPCDAAFLIPTHTLGPWLDAAVWSALNQETGYRFRVVIALDGVAPDLSSAWLQRAEAVLVRSERRRGLAGVLHYALESIAEPIILRLDGDDLAEPDRLERQLRHLTNDPEVAVLGSRAWRIDERSQIVGTLGTTGSDMAVDLVQRNRLIHSSVAFRRSVYDAAGGYQPRLRTMEDYDLWLRMARYAKVSVIPERLVRYRIHSGQMSRRATPWGNHIRAVSRGQAELSDALGLPKHFRLRAQVAWRAAQYLRYFRLRAPGYDR